MSIGRFLYRRRWCVVVVWAAVATTMLLTVPSIDPGRNESPTFLPSDAPSWRAVEALQEAFPGRGALGEVAVVFERRGGKLTGDDLAAVEAVAKRIRKARTPTAEFEGVTVRSPQSLGLPMRSFPGVPAPRNPLLSRSGQAALVLVNVPSSYVTIRASRIVAHIRGIFAEAPLPDGLNAAVTGSCGFGHDYAEAAERSHTRTMYVSLTAVILILLLVYRAPLAAMVPLSAISLAAVVAMSVLGIGSAAGMHIGTAEKIFVFVLLYGAGTDYSLLLISRYREYLQTGASVPDAAAGALDATRGAILASAGTDAAGLMMLVFARYRIFRTTGPAVAIALVVALLAAVTLVPALLGILGRRTFWPGGRGARSDGRSPLAGGRRLWPAVARLVTARPGLVLIVTVLVLGIPAARALKLTWVYDTLTEATGPSGDAIGHAAEGLKMARRHWPVGEIAPVRILIRAERPRSAEAWEPLAAKLTAAVSGVHGVEDVRSLSQPLGTDVAPATTAMLKTFGSAQIRGEYLSADGRALRMDAVLDKPALTLGAMSDLAEIRRTAARAVAKTPLEAQVMLAGATAEMADLRNVTQRDFYLIIVLVLGVIFLIVVALLRDVILSAFMVVSIVLGYLATLGIAFWVFTGLLGAEGLDWKVEVFLFVVIAAVGVDYNIFLAARFTQEARRLPPRRAVRQAVIHTGPVISSCGVIMAATLGSLMAGELALLEQLGFALALGMGMDTFIIRPLLLPAFVVLTRRCARTGSPLDRSAHEVD